MIPGDEVGVADFNEGDMDQLWGAPSVRATRMAQRGEGTGELVSGAGSQAGPATGGGSVGVSCEDPAHDRARGEALLERRRWSLCAR